MDGVSDYGVWGLGVGSADAYLLKKYEVRKANESFYVELLNKQYGPHNQYLKEWMELGPIAMLLLLFIVVGSPFFLKGAVRRDTIILGMLFGIGLFTETILGRMSGIFIVCTMLVLVIAEGWHKDSLPPVHP